MKNSQIMWLVGLVTSVSTALINEGSLARYHHIISIVAILSTALTGYMLQHPWNGKERRKENMVKANQRYHRIYQRVMKGRKT